MNSSSNSPSSARGLSKACNCEVYAVHPARNWEHQVPGMVHLFFTCSEEPAKEAKVYASVRHVRIAEGFAGFKN